MWALGVVLYRCLTGVLPFQGESVLETLEHIKTVEVRPVREHCPNTPLDVETVCLDCLRKCPQERPTMSQARARLSHLSGGTLVPQTAAPRRRVPLLVAMLLALGGLIGVGAFTLIRIQSEQGNYVIETDDPDFSFQVVKGAVTLQDRKTNRKYNLKLLRQDRAGGEYELEVTDADAGLVFKTKSFTIKRGKRSLSRPGSSASKSWSRRGRRRPSTTPG